MNMSRMSQRNARVIRWRKDFANALGDCAAAAQVAANGITEMASKIENVIVLVRQIGEAKS